MSFIKVIVVYLLVWIGFKWCVDKEEEENYIDTRGL